jgi:L-ascorbate metabolism protein UlaG (beta-lactamase superfamily)
MNLTVTRVRQSCVLLDFGGQVVLIDPWFSERPESPRRPRGMVFQRTPT